MNKTEPVREAHDLRDFRSSDLGKFGSDKLTSIDGARSNESLASGVWNFQSPVLTDFACLGLPNIDTSELREGANS